jgi:arsenate reductase
VIFACTDSAGRSQMAAAFFNLLADESRARAISAGARVGACGYGDEVAAVMREAGLDLARFPPQRLTAPLAAGAQHLVTMGCREETPFFAGVKVEDWPVEDPREQPIEHVRAIRDDIRARVERMLEEHGWARTPAARTGTGG